MIIGKFVQQSAGYTAFVPAAFPASCDLQFSTKLMQQANQATLLLGKLNGIVTLVPDLDYFLFAELVKTAENAHPNERDEILHYFQILDFALEQLNNRAFSVKMLKALHKQLLHTAATTHFAEPGKLRKGQNWINGPSYFDAAYVPPPPEYVKSCLADLIKFMRRKDNILPIVKAGIIFAQFETIHPFWDGNGRLGRLLLALYLWQEKLIECPIFFTAPFFKSKENNSNYCLNQYRKNKIEIWLEFFLEIIMATTLQIIEKGQKLHQLYQDITAKENTAAHRLQQYCALS